MSTDVSAEHIASIFRVEYAFVGFEVLTAVVMKSTVFWNIMPYSPLNVNEVSEEHITSIFRVEYAFVGFHLLCLPPASTLVSCSVYSLTLKIEAICSSETSVDIQQTTQNYIPEDSILQTEAPLPSCSQI
jgi:hypothetical protein